MYFPLVKTPSEPVTDTVQQLPASRMAIGLARANDNGVILHGRQINSQTGGRVGGEQTGGSYIEIPPRTLKADIPLTFAIYVSADDVVIFDGSQGK